MTVDWDIESLPLWTEGRCTYCGRLITNEHNVLLCDPCAEAHREMEKPKTVHSDHRVLE